MEFYLVREGHVDLERVLDPYAAGLSALGRQQAERIGSQACDWGIELLCASTAIRAQETADAIQAALPDIMRWDLKELEELTIDDLEGLPSPGPRVATWPEALRQYGYERTWIRVMAALARIRIYAESNGCARIALIAHSEIINLLLLSWLELDWRSLATVRFELEPGSYSKVTCCSEGGTRIEWVNRV